MAHKRKQLILISAVFALLVGVSATSITGLAQQTVPRSFHYVDGKPLHALRDGEFRVHHASLPPTSGKVYIYASLGMPAVNPVPYLQGSPIAAQFVTLGETRAGKFLPAIRFGLKERETLAGQRAQLMPWVFDGTTNHFGGYARPATLYDFRIELDTATSSATVFTAGRGDDHWFMLAEDVGLIFPVSEINEVLVEQYADAAGVHDLSVQQVRNPAREVLVGSDTGRKRRVTAGRGFRFQSMRSVWRERGRHVVISRDERRWQGFADVALSKTGRLLATYCDGPKHGGNGKAVIRSSDDWGKTWSGEQTMEALRGANERIQKLKDGSLLFTSGEMYPTVDFQQSLDDGKTWTVIGSFDVRSFGLYQHYAMSHVLESADGTWFIVGSDMVGKEQRERLQVFASGNRGREWHLRALIDTFPTTGHGGSEASILELSDGRLAIYARESRNDGFPGFRVFSNDKGNTWSEPEDLPIQTSGRILANFLADGRVMLTTRTWIGRPALWAWIENPSRRIGFQISGVHYNDKSSKGLKDGVLYIDNDGRLGQFTRYLLRPPSAPEDEVSLIANVMVLENQGNAATVSIPFAGRLSIYPEHAVFSGGTKEVTLSIAAQTFHTYVVKSGKGRVTIHIDGKLALDTTDVDQRNTNAGCLPFGVGPLLFSFGNYPTPELFSQDAAPCSTAMLPFQITPGVTGLALWKSVEVVTVSQNGREHRTSWIAAKDGFPDQYQLDNVIEVEATVSGMDQGYSGWVQLPDNRVFVVNYTDDTAVIWPGTNTFPYGCSWIRGTYLLPSDLDAVTTVR
ncbi:MAG TPA: sialidase family protein [Pyrinomonadaceae bacterium]|nr:sialidase family protein [Pyrinomonadaceae bacterium]